MVTAAKLPIDTSASAQAMAEAMFGSGIEIMSASYTGAGLASGIYTNGDAIAPDLTPSDTGVILSTGKASDVTQASGDPNRAAGTSTNFQNPGRADLNEIAGATTYDAATFEATFVPAGSILTMQIVFSSEEYLEYVNSGFNDAVGIFVNGEQAELTVGDGDITINNINSSSNENLFLNNPANTDPYNTEMDGLTVTMTLKAPVLAGQENTIIIAIADGGDGVYDSNLLIAGDSIQSVLLAEDDAVTLKGFTPIELDVLANDQSITNLSLTITEINGISVQPGDEIELSTGQIVTLTSNGTLSIVGDAELSTDAFSYQVTDSEGNNDVAFVTLNTTPCFVAGTLIKTMDGEIPVEDLQPGARVLTFDNGYQELRWVGQTVVRAEGKHAPIDFQAGALGNHDALSLSPNHRVMLKSAQAQLYFGASEVLVKAKYLVNDTKIRQRPSSMETVTYVHLLFDQHEIVWGNGLASESYHPGRETIDSFDPETRAEVLELMPNLDALCGFGYGPTARTVLKSREVPLVLADTAMPLALAG